MDGVQSWIRWPKKRRSGLEYDPDGSTTTRVQDRGSGSNQTNNLIQHSESMDPNSPTQRRLALLLKPDQHLPVDEIISAISSGNSSDDNEAGPATRSSLAWGTARENCMPLAGPSHSPAMSSQTQPGDISAHTDNSAHRSGSLNAIESAELQAFASRDAFEGADGLRSDDALQCLICCEPIQLVSFGKCGHQAACGRCCLRMRICYGFMDCPLCKTKLPEVVIAPWRKEIPSFAFFHATPGAAARSNPGQLGPGRILADRWDPIQQELNSGLLRDLVGATSIACRVCDPKGHQPFARVTELESHIWDEHRLHACGTCLRDTRNFFLEVPLHDTRRAVHDHGITAHPICRFCFGPAFTDREEFISHLRFHHFQCYVCETSPDDPASWFKDAGALREHLAAHHITCDDPLCGGTLVAFRTVEELHEHQIEYHTRLGRGAAGRLGTDFRVEIKKWPLELIVAVLLTSIAFILSRMYPVNHEEALT